MLRFMETGEALPFDGRLSAGEVFRDAEADGTVFDRRRERLNNAIELLARGIEGITTSEGCRAYLEAMGRFHTYSANNVAFIWTSVPCQSAHVAATLPRISTAPSRSGFKPAMCSTCAFFS